MKKVGSRDIKEILRAVRQDSRRRMTSRVLRALCVIAVIVGLLNFLFFLAGSFFIGGDRVEAGKYYVWGYNYQNGTREALRRL
jgi:hypothetical protein